MGFSAENSLQSFVDRLTCRSILTEGEKQAALSLPTHLVKVWDRQDFVHINEHVTYSSFIASGLAGRFGQTASGARQFTAFHIPGDMVDLHAAVRPIGLGGLTALCDTTILRVPHAEIRILAARFPALAEAFWRDSLLDSAILMQWVINVGRRDARTRIAHAICEMSIRYGRDREVLSKFDFPVTQEQLADATALTAVHVNRSLKALRETGIVDLSRGRVHIHDWHALAKSGDFEPNYLIADTKPERQKRLLSQS
ncbi:Crp/Fnr family transcriptional regulator [uncultured Sphingomonas sp.]|uniref:Crp/Fnr family transcriptional regulator n=1 Tax=Sphingomonas sp. 179-A 2A2 NHS TaxID=3374290 RepID=UPI0025FC113B|nr:Crp/Fnr family transcriptional regulator [uncultured Sphingomonas sp.]